MNYDASKPDGYPHFCTKNKNNQESTEKAPLAPLGRMGCDAPPELVEIIV